MNKSSTFEGSLETDIEETTTAVMVEDQSVEMSMLQRSYSLPEGGADDDSAAFSSPRSPQGATNLASVGESGEASMDESEADGGGSTIATTAVTEGGDGNDGEEQRLQQHKSLIDDTTTMHPDDNTGDGDGEGEGGETDVEMGQEQDEEKELQQSCDERGFDDEDDEDGLLGEEYEYLVGDVNCWFRPTRVSSAKDCGRRTVDWLSLNKEQIMSAITVAINQVPAVSSSAFIAGLSPALALQSTWMVNIITSLVGGGPGMISGSTGFIGLSLVDLVRNEGVPYVFWAVMFAGVLQVAFGLLGLGRIMRLIPRPLQIGFQNGMGLLLVVMQFRYARVFPDQGDKGRRLVKVGHSWSHFSGRGSDWIGTQSFIAWGIEALVALLICIFLPKLMRAVPSTFVAIVIASLFEWVIFRRFDNWHSPTVGDYADITGTVPKPVWLTYDMPPFSLDTFLKIYLHGLAVFGVSLMESLLTLNLIDELNEVSGLRNHVSIGQGIGNVASSIFGGMGGAGMVGQTMIANKADGITGLSTFLTGFTLMVIFFLAYPLINYIPLAAFAGVMFYSAHCLIEYNSLLMGIAALIPERARDQLRLDYKIPRVEVLIMLTVTVSILAFDLAIAVCAGVLLAAFVYVWDSSTRVVVEREPSDDGKSVTYNISGPLFFATAQNFVEIFAIEDIELDPEDVIIMLEGAEVHDSSGMFALKKLHDRYVAMGKTVALSSLSLTSRRIMEKYASTWEGVSFLEVEEIEDEEYADESVIHSTKEIA